MSSVDYKARKKQFREEQKARRKATQKRIRQIKEDGKITRANSNKYLREKKADIQESYEKTLADIDYNYKEKKLIRNAKFEQNKVIRDYQSGKIPENKALKLLDRIKKKVVNNDKRAAKIKQKKYKKAEESHAFKAILIDAKYNRSCRSTAGKIFVLILSVVILAIKVGMFFVTDLIDNEKKAEFIHNTISGWTTDRTWVALLVIPTMLILLYIINALPAIHDKLHELISGVATAFVANLLVTVSEENPILVGKVALDNAEYIVAVLGTFLIVLLCLTATSYAPMRTMFTLRRQNKNSEMLINEAIAMKDTNNPNAEQRNGYYNIATSQFSGGLFSTIIYTVIFLFAVVVTAIWLIVLNSNHGSMYYTSILLLLVFPSAINIVDISGRPKAEENLLNNLVDAGAPFLEKFSRIKLFIKNIIPSRNK